jgi:Glyoxalase/Bleomycin resistance protein/Dioxygenase superfamily
MPNLSSQLAPACSYERGQISRRKFVLALSAMAITPRAMAQTIKPAIVTRRLNNVMIAVSDMKRSLDFYQKLFGTPVRQLQMVCGEAQAGAAAVAASVTTES